MTTTQTTARTTTYRAERTPNPLLGALFCLAILIGGGIAGHTWAVDTCAAGTDLGVVCQVTA